MAGPGDHPIEELLPAYALNALEPAEREQVEAHLAGCDRCAATLAQHLEVSSALALGHLSVIPSAALRARVLGPSEEPAMALGPPRAGPWGVSWTGGTARVLGAVAATLVLAVVGLSVFAVNQNDRIGRMEDDSDLIAVQLQEQRNTAYWAAIPGVSTVAMRGTGDPRPRAMFMVNPEHTLAMLVALDLPTLPGGLIYQLWLVEKDGTPVGVAVFAVDESGYAQVVVRMPEDMTEIQSVSVSREPAGGTETPSDTEVLSVTLPQP